MVPREAKSIHNAHTTSATRRIREQFAQRIEVIGGQRQTQLCALRVETLVEFDRMQIGEARVQQRQGREWQGKFDRDELDQFDLCRKAQTLGCTTAVGTRKSARTELDPAEPARDDDRSVVHMLRVNCLQNGLACGAARLAIVAESMLLAYAIGPAIVRRVRVGDGPDEDERCFGRCHACCICGEFAFADFLGE